MQLGCTAATANPSSDPADPNRCLFHGTIRPRLRPRHRESLRTGPTERCAVGATWTNADCSKSAVPSRVTTGKRHSEPTRGLAGADNALSPRVNACRVLHCVRGYRVRVSAPAPRQESFLPHRPRRRRRGRRRECWVAHQRDTRCRAATTCGSWRACSVISEDDCTGVRSRLHYLARSSSIPCSVGDRSAVGGQRPDAAQRPSDLGGILGATITYINRESFILLIWVV